MWEFPFSNWLVSLAGGAASYLVLLICLVFSWTLFKQYRALKNAKAAGAVPSYTGFFMTGAVFGLVLVSVFSLPANAPKYQLKVSESAPDSEQFNKPLPQTQNLAPKQLTAEQSSARLEQLRAAQKQSGSTADKTKP